MVSESVAVMVRIFRRILVRRRVVGLVLVLVLVRVLDLWIPNTPRTSAAMALRFRPEVGGGVS